MSSRRGRRRWRTAAAVVGLGLMAAGPAGSAAAQDDGVSEAIAALVPDDADDLSTEQVDSFLNEMQLFLEDTTPATGGDSALTGPCGGFAFSFDEDDTLIDVAYDVGDAAPPQDLLDGGQAFTSDNPFVVDAGGTVTYIGFAPSSGPGPMDHTYSLQVAGFTVASGGDPNENGNNRNAGTIDIGDEMPIDLSVAFSAGGKLEASDFPGCEGEGHVELQGAGLLGPVGLIGMGAAAIGLIGLVAARPARTWRQG